MGTLIPSAVIISASVVSETMANYIAPGDFVVACDAGYRNAEKLDVTPDLIVGDFDSAPRPPEAATAQKKTIVLPHIKDDTDTHYAARWLLAHGCQKITLLGVLGGARMEHSMANIATGLYLAQNGVKVCLANEFSELYYLLPGQPLMLAAENAFGRWKYFSLFPLEGSMEGVTVTGAFYPLDNARLTADYPLAVSNEFTEPAARLQCRAGSGLVILTKADG